MTRPLSRVLALLEILQTGGTHSAATLADRLGVDERTARRYVQHLIDLDVPVRAVRGRYGGFRLAPGYRMPPLMLTDEEALAILLGLMAGRASGAIPAPAAATESAAAKVRRVLPQQLATRLDRLALSFAAPRRTESDSLGHLGLLAEAAGARRAVRIEYRDSGERTIHPYGVVAHGGHWYVTGADSASGEDRTFRLDRIRAASLLTETFETVAQSDLLTVLAESPRRHAVSVRVQATADHLDRRVPRGLATVESLDDGTWFRVRLQVEELDWVPSLLAWIDRPFVIEQPAALNDHVRALADRLAGYA